MSKNNILTKIFPPRLKGYLIEVVNRLRGDSKRRRTNYQSVARPSNTLEAIISYNEYGGYCIPSSSAARPAAAALLKSKIYEPETLSFMRANCGTGNIVHAGTYFGDFLPGLSEALQKGRIVYAFEPNLESFRCAKITCLINGLENVQLQNSGVGDHTTTAYLRARNDSGESLGGGSNIVCGGESWSEGVEEIDIVKIDDIVSDDQFISIIQLDVEGSEKSALTGALNTIRRCKLILIIEDLDTSSLLESEWFEEHIMGLNYRYEGAVHNNKVYKCAG